jgi:translation initiation factor IF-2
VDKPQADALRVKKQLADHGVTTEDWGGQVLAVETAALRNQGLDKVLEAISLQAEIMELTGDVAARPEGVVIESTLDRGRGPVITVLIRRGVLHVGDAFIVGGRAGRVRALFDAVGKAVKEAGPSVPATILGAEVIPDAGDRLIGMPTDKVARSMAALLVAEPPREVSREELFSLDEWYKQMQEGGQKELNLVVKADVTGSLEAVTEQINRLGNDEVRPKMLHGGVGVVNEGDVLLAGASRAVVIAFRVAAETKAKQLAQREGVEIRPYDVIYEAIADVRAALEGLLEPEIITEVVGTVEIRQVFEVAGGRIAGSFVKSGRAVRGAQARVRRGDAVVYEGHVSSLRRFRDDVKEVQQGYECGIQLRDFNDPEPGDVIEILEERRVARRLESR